MAAGAQFASYGEPGDYVPTRTASGHQETTLLHSFTVGHPVVIAAFFQAAFPVRADSLIAHPSDDSATSGRNILIPMVRSHCWHGSHSTPIWASASAESSFAPVRPLRVFRVLRFCSSASFIAFLPPRFRASTLNTPLVWFRLRPVAERSVDAILILIPRVR